MHICQLTISSCQNGLNDYVTQIEDLLHLLGSTPTNKLLLDLSFTSSSIFCNIISIKQLLIWNKVTTWVKNTYLLASIYVLMLLKFDVSRNKHSNGMLLLQMILTFKLCIPLF